MVLHHRAVLCCAVQYRGNVQADPRDSAMSIKSSTCRRSLQLLEQPCRLHQQTISSVAGQPRARDDGGRSGPLPRPSLAFWSLKLKAQSSKLEAAVTMMMRPKLLLYE